MPLKRELIIIDDQDQTDSVAEYSEEGDRIRVVFKSSRNPYFYGKDKAKILKTAVSRDQALNVFNYLKDIANVVGLKTEEGQNILARSYQSITTIPESCALNAYLNEVLPPTKEKEDLPEFFPFGFNLSQREAVHNAFTNKLSVIEGPPGTGKTQTILNIIANAFLKGQSVAVVSSNNSATQNVYDKLAKNGIEFIAALLGNAQNKKDFIDAQTDVPNLSDHHLSDSEKAELKSKSTSLVTKLSNNLHKKNELASLRLTLENLETEFKHFRETHQLKDDQPNPFRKNIKADKILQLWLKLETQNKRKASLWLIRRLLYQWQYGIKDKSFFTKALGEMILICQAEYYPSKIRELIARIEALERSLRHFSFEDKMKEYTQLSMQLFKAELSERYKGQKRKHFSSKDFRHKAHKFIQEYPVIMSTTYSLRQSLSTDIQYDFVIIDEASQVDLATGALALSCAKQVVIVGDTKQLPNVVNAEMQEKTDTLFHAYQLKEAYCYSGQSLLSSILALFPEIPKTLLREHYRCHPKIIEFCNQKFYNNQLIVHTEYSEKRKPLIVYRTAPGNHARERMNQRQIDIIKQEIIPNEGLSNMDLGIVTPYRNQTNALQSAFKGTEIKSDTVDKFQGRENEVIILSTVDNSITNFTDNPNRLNVAVSRAIDQLIVVVNGNEEKSDGNISDLVKYIEYNNYKVVQSELSSIFDLLYKGYEEARSKYIRKSERISDYDSENLMYALIKEVLAQDRFIKYGVLPHFPLRQLLRDLSKLEPQEKRYASNPLTHIDFLLYNKLSKTPVLAIEVDGFEYHKQGSKQAKRDRYKDQILKKYNLPILRFKTNESNEKQRLTQKLKELQRPSNPSK